MNCDCRQKQIINRSNLRIFDATYGAGIAGSISHSQLPEYTFHLNDLSKHDHNNDSLKSLPLQMWYDLYGSSKASYDS